MIEIMRILLSNGAKDSSDDFAPQGAKEFIKNMVITKRNSGERIRPKGLDALIAEFPDFFKD